jgi:hypothetical protein
MTIAPAPIHFAWPTNSIMMSLPWGTGTTGWRNGKRAPMVRPRPLARQRHLAPADQPHVGDGVVGGATRPGGDEGGGVSAEAGDAVEAGGAEGVGQGQIGENRGQPPR